MGKTQYMFAGVGLILIVVLYFLIHPSSSFSPKKKVQSTQVRNVTLQIKRNKLVEGEEIISVHEGDTVVLTIQSDSLHEIHLHGYDKMVEVSATTSSRLKFVANQTGHFTYEIEDTKTEISALDVFPK